MNKIALSPAEVLLYSTLAGGGTFGIAKLFQDMQRAKENQDTAGAQRNALNIDLPSSNQLQTPKLAIAKQAEGEEIMKALAVMGGVPAGFMGTKALYDAYQKKQLQTQLDKVHQQYALALQQAQAAPKMAADAATPLVDAVCEGFADALAKQADASDAFGLNDVSGLWPISALAPSAKDAFMGVAGVSGLGVLGALIAANKKKEQAEARVQYPDQVQLNQLPPIEQGAGPITSQ